VFPQEGLDRRLVRWDEHLYTMTPVEHRGGVWFKREDHFAPLGLGGINGAKLRQCIWLAQQHTAKGGNGWMVTGASVKSPQLSMGTAVARHFGMRSRLVVGATNPKSGIKRENVLVAAWLGAEFDIIPVAYNPQLQQRVRKHLGVLPGAWHLEYGISVEHKTAPPETLEAFHRVGAAQVANIPPEVESLVLPAGS
jgi:hypothetical protein